MTENSRVLPAGGNLGLILSIVAIGRYEGPNGEFAADKLLVKCPSKYQGAEVEEKVYG